jgi:hypothetical protein
MPCRLENRQVSIDGGAREISVFTPRIRLWRRDLRGILHAEGCAALADLAGSEVSSSKTRELSKSSKPLARA